MIENNYNFNLKESVKDQLLNVIVNYTKDFLFNYLRLIFCENTELTDFLKKHKKEFEKSKNQDDLLLKIMDKFNHQFCHRRKWKILKNLF